MNKSGPIKPKAKRKDSALDEDTGELLADNADDASDESESCGILHCDRDYR
jgi:ribosome biogenesis protein MAK21